MICSVMDVVAPSLDRETLIRRLLLRTSKYETGCWVWEGAKRAFGYGVMKIGGRAGALFFTHRLSYALFVGPIPPGMLICHKCDNPPCLNPDHLFLGSASDNMRDMFNKGRWSSGKATKLLKAQVLEIRALEGIVPARIIAERYGLARRSVYQILRRDTWRHI